MHKTIQYRWVILGLIFFSQLSQAINFQGIPPILGMLVQSLDLSYAQAGSLISLYSLPRIFLSLPSGVMVDRYGTWKVGCFSLLTLTLGAVMVAAGNSYWFLGMGRFLAGVGASFLIVVTLHGLTSWFREREMGLSMGFFHVAMPLGTILSLNFGGIIAAYFGWRAPIFVIFILCFTVLVFFIFFYREMNVGQNIQSEPLNLFRIAKTVGWRIWLVGLMWTLLNASVIPYFTYAPDYFVSQGRSVGQAGLLSSYPMWASIIMAPMVGLLIDRVGKKRLLIFIGFAANAILFYLIPRFSQQATVFAMTIGIFTAILPTPIFSLPAKLLPDSARGVGFGILTTSGAVGMALGPYITGMLRDFTGDYLWCFNTMAVFSALGLLPVLLLKIPPERKSGTS